MSRTSSCSCDGTECVSANQFRGLGSLSSTQILKAKALFPLLREATFCGVSSPLEVPQLLASFPDQSHIVINRMDVVQGGSSLNEAISLIEAGTLRRVRKLKLVAIEWNSLVSLLELLPGLLSLSIHHLESKGQRAQWPPLPGLARLHIEHCSCSPSVEEAESMIAKHSFTHFNCPSLSIALTDTILDAIAPASFVQANFFIADLVVVLNRLTIRGIGRFMRGARMLNSDMRTTIATYKPATYMALFRGTTSVDLHLGSLTNETIANPINAWDWTVFHVAAFTSVAYTQTLCSLSANFPATKDALNVRAENGETALHFAALAHRMEVRPLRPL